MHRHFAVLPLLLVGACAAAIEADTVPPPVMRWEANLTGTQQFPEVTAEANVIRTVGVTTVELRLAGGQPGATHPWHIHHGTCAQSGGIVGEPGSYPPLRVEQVGTAVGTAVIDFELQPGQPFHINVHRSANEMGTIVACGDLQEAARS
jgi:hypothetical protein